MVVCADPFEIWLKPIDAALNAFSVAEFDLRRDAAESGHHRRQRGVGEVHTPHNMPFSKPHEILRGVSRRGTKYVAVARPRSGQWKIAVDRARPGNCRAVGIGAFPSTGEIKSVKGIGLQGDGLGAPESQTLAVSLDHERASVLMGVGHAAAIRADELPACRLILAFFKLRIGQEVLRQANA